METERKLFRRLACLESKDHKYSDFYVLTEVHKKETFYRHIDEHRNTIAELIAHHLNISPSDCRVEARENWLGGGFNVGVPVTVVAGDNNNASQRVLIRFPLPYRVGEQIRPGNADEKVRCEAATYAWISQECPSIPIPHLYGFALSTGQLVRTSAFSLSPYLPNLLFFSQLFAFVD